MLPAPHRLRRSDEFGRTVRHGVRAGRSTLVVHVAPDPGSETAKVGFVVSKAVGNAVTRNLVKRRLRAASADLVPDLTEVAVVVRALPASSDARYDQLAGDLRSAVAAAYRRLPTGRV
ncbi:ribonuclease P protein component [Luteimicrobium subarcticum]|uniref:Ribonuclease P protein component n=1 Tax=Luteimicrobium subarcticum TaxID=620910 RepID=A0A2M8WJG0_9MICO|nr:ribonuclease P protein component [Luteimicrobium subarcticum]PJI91070.1 ribonuclease P protein component [Luteimicrobium subarcticum]